MSRVEPRLNRVRSDLEETRRNRGNSGCADSFVVTLPVSFRIVPEGTDKIVSRPRNVPKGTDKTAGVGDSFGSAKIEPTGYVR